MVNLNKQSLIAIDGPRNVGKTHLINLIKDRPLYKQPFADWYTKLYAPIDGHLHNTDNQIFQFVAGMDITILDTYNQNLLTKGIVIDRLFLSNSVYAVQAGRHTIGKSYEYLSYLMDSGYLSKCWSIFIDAEILPDLRNKDQWSIYQPQKTRDLYYKMLTHLESIGYKKIYKFHNKLDHISESEFLNLISNIE